jgi:hypothetical protein
MKLSNSNADGVSQEDFEKYQKAWEETMIKIWREKIERFKVIDTGALHERISGNVATLGSDSHTIIHKFLMYGIYQDCGTGNGYRRGNGGNLEFLDPLTRKNRRQKQKSGKVTSGEPRKERLWFSRAYWRSRQVLKEQMAYMYGEEFIGILAEALDDKGRNRHI